MKVSYFALSTILCGCVYAMGLGAVERDQQLKCKTQRVDKNSERTERELSLVNELDSSKLALAAIEGELRGLLRSKEGFRGIEEKFEDHNRAVEIIYSAMGFHDARQSALEELLGKYGSVPRFIDMIVDKARSESDVEVEAIGMQIRAAVNFFELQPPTIQDLQNSLNSVSRDSQEKKENKFRSLELKDFHDLSKYLIIFRESFAKEVASLDEAILKLEVKKQTIRKRLDGTQRNLLDFRRQDLDTGVSHCR